MSGANAVAFVTLKSSTSANIFVAPIVVSQSRFSTLPARWFSRQPLHLVHRLTSQEQERYVGSELCTLWLPQSASWCSLAHSLSFISRVALGLRLLAMLVSQK